MLYSGIGLLTKLVGIRDSIVQVKDQLKQLQVPYERPSGVTVECSKTFSASPNP